MAIIKLKRSNTPGNTPASLEHGEVAINISDKKIYIGSGDTNDTAVLIVDGNASGVSTETIQDAAASLFTSGTHTGISVSYPDTNNAINLVNTGVLSFNTRIGAVSLTSSDVTTALGFTPISGVSTETIQDAAASLFTSGTHTGISVTYPDTNNAINLSIDSSVVTLTGTQILTNKTWNSQTIGVIYGGTGQTTYATGDLLYASATNTLSKLTKPASLTSFLQMTAAGVPSWTSTIPTTNGGTGLTSFTSGGLVFASSTSALTTGTVFDIDSTANVNRINIASGASPKPTQEFMVSETTFNSSAAIGVYTDVSDNPPGSLGHAYINLTSFTGTDTLITLSQSSGDGSVVFAGGATPLSLTAVPSLWGQSVGILYCINDESNPYIIFGDDGTNNETSIKITDTSSTMVVQASTLKINTTTPAAGKILTCTDSNGTVSWEDNAAADMILFSMGFI